LNNILFKAYNKVESVMKATLKFKDPIRGAQAYNRVVRLRGESTCSNSNGHWTITKEGISFSGTRKGFEDGCSLFRPTPYGVIVRATLPISYSGEWIVRNKVK